MGASFHPDDTRRKQETGSAFVRSRRATCHHRVGPHASVALVGGRWSGRCFGRASLRARPVRKYVIDDFGVERLTTA